MAFDRRLTPARDDLAAAHLEGDVDAARFVEGRAMRVATALLPLTLDSDPEAPLDTQLLHGEAFTLYDVDEDTGLAWGQAGADGYVGWVPHAGLTPAADPAPRHHPVAQVAGDGAGDEAHARP
ncbi:MAG: hypothetical protein ACPGID_13975, partial [Rubricella sp.]